MSSLELEVSNVGSCPQDTAYLHAQKKDSLSHYSVDSQTRSQRFWLRVAKCSSLQSA